MNITSNSQQNKGVSFRELKEQRKYHNGTATGHRKSLQELIKCIKPNTTLDIKETCPLFGIGFFTTATTTKIKEQLGPVEVQNRKLLRTNSTFKSTSGTIKARTHQRNYHCLSPTPNSKSSLEI